MPRSHFLDSEALFREFLRRVHAPGGRMVLIFRWFLAGCMRPEVAWYLYFAVFSRVHAPGGRMVLRRVVLIGLAVGVVDPGGEAGVETVGFEERLYRQVHAVAPIVG